MPRSFLTPVLWFSIAAVAITLWLLWWLLRRRAARGHQVDGRNSIDLSEFVVGGPPVGSPRMDFYGTPVRLQLIVLAPMGRHSQLPSNEELPHVLNHFISGFTGVSGLHRPVVFRWPEQLSAQGFYQAFFNQLSLPGDHGRGSAWCAVAGRFTVADRQYLVGMAFTSEKPNGMGTVTVQHEGQWLDVLRIRESSD
jgi:hypothetical protein